MMLILITAFTGCWREELPRRWIALRRWFSHHRKTTRRWIIKLTFSA